MKVFRLVIYFNEKFEDIRYGDIEEVDMPEEHYKMFKWDRLIRVDFLEKNHFIMLSINRDRLEDFCLGFYQGNNFKESCSFINKELLQKKYEKFLESGEDKDVIYSENEKDYNLTFFKVK